MKHSKEEIMGALKVIKDECEAHYKSCFGCPFYGSRCEVCRETPRAWKIDKPEPEIWRAFK